MSDKTPKTAERMNIQICGTTYALDSPAGLKDFFQLINQRMVDAEKAERRLKALADWVLRCAGENQAQLLCAVIDMRNGDYTAIDNYKTP